MSLSSAHSYRVSISLCVQPCRLVQIHLLIALYCNLNERMLAKAHKIYYVHACVSDLVPTTSIESDIYIIISLHMATRLHWSS